MLGDFMKPLVEVLEGSISYVWFIVIAILGGTANYMGRVKRGEVRKFSTAELLGEWLVSGFAALLTAYLCVEFKFSWEITAFLCGISGHMGGRAIFALEIMVLRKFNLKDDKDDK